jgi:thiamine biosynthesis lipoprotein
MRTVQAVLAILIVGVALFWVNLQFSRNRSELPDTQAPRPAAGLVVVHGARPQMGTIWEITIATYEKPRREVSDVVDEAFAEIARVDQALSDWRDGTELYEVNRHAGLGPVAVSQDMYDVVERAHHFSEISDGAFDITFNVMWGVWDFKKRPATLPDAGQISRRLALINYRNVVLDAEARTIFLRQKGMKLGLGGIGKGYAVDRVCMLLEKHGLRHYIVAGGGDIRVAGSRGKDPWRLAVKHPRQQGVLYLLDMTDVAVATSGDYESYFVLNGKRYHHILDPKTGHPARGVSSVTIIAPQATDADALSTAVFVLGVEKGMALLKAIPEVEAIVVDLDLRSSLTGGLQVTQATSTSTPIVRRART